MRMKRAMLVIFALLAAAPSMAAASESTRVCIEVELKEIEEEVETQEEGRHRWSNESHDPFLPLGQTPVLYLKRLIEHYVTHEMGFLAVQEQCDETVHVELYPLATGWTVFARYSANGREERVDQLFTNELSRFAERVVLALLYDVPIGDTIRRDTVLRSDSREAEQVVEGTHHLMVRLGAQLRSGMFQTAQDDGQAQDQIRLFNLMTVSTGYRGKFENWGVEAMADLGIGTSKTAARQNSGGGHVDLDGKFGLSLHFLHYISPRGLTSFYLGAGSTFELLWFSAIEPEARRTSDARSTLYGGGLDVNLICGWEFMRASSVQFLLQAEIHLPVYLVQNADENGEIETWAPGASVALGILF